MTKMTWLYILIPLLVLGIFIVTGAKSPDKYKYLFRNTILSKSQKLELGAVLRGRVYYPRYFYIPTLKQYLVYSDVDETGPFHSNRLYNNDWGKVHARLDEQGNVLESFKTDLRFSTKSGCFYGPKTYIPWLESGKIDQVPYDSIYNETFELGQNAFNALLIELYQHADYVEYINLRASNDDLHQAAVIFRREGKVEILLSGLRDSRLNCNFQENKMTNNFEDYYSPIMRDATAYADSPPRMQLIALETNNDNPFLYWRRWFKNPFRIEAYKSEESQGWVGIMEFHGIPIYLPEDGLGSAYVRFSVKGDLFRFKVLDVYKSSFLPLYNLGLRTFQLPESIRTEHSLTFMESVQNSGQNRLGGGVFVVRSSTQSNSSADLPSGLTEERFNTLPINLQEALMHPDNATDLIIHDKSISTWIPEIELLKNLKHLELNTSMTEIPDEIAKFPQLQELIVQNGQIQRVSPQLATLQNLTLLDLYSNNLTAFPECILQLKNLERLDIGYNEISSLPAEISGLHRLKNLELISTNLSSLPESMIDMKQLYIYDAGSLQNKLSSAYQHLFELKFSNEQ
ncbi:leucine-rich repeat domain-containing protein [Reichenbachiella agarivorans]|uniref:Leucine-rich repeat domain-containing protein n=1 Tax=Reichenbachiella agarivorans TaxID=2979464 RepID=A0ABY6CQF8_9BACT|nr:leucine-rich repeat domain-containing protein [Reichenbachiella agarivorans]UXP32599.1 leucine-rich repeat domain-containing protein [Reichenbachiella agarivorans]